MSRLRDSEPHPDAVALMSDGEPESKWQHVPVNRADELFTWGSKTVVPTWCQTPEHWTSRVVDYLWVDCPCCLFFRGVVLGYASGLCIGAVAALIIRILLQELLVL